jgi:hypothetical protein
MRQKMLIMINRTFMFYLFSSDKFGFLLTKFVPKNKPVESTDYETGLPDATLMEV